MKQSVHIICKRLREERHRVTARTLPSLEQISELLEMGLKSTYFRVMCSPVSAVVSKGEEEGWGAGSWAKHIKFESWSMEACK